VDAVVWNDVCALLSEPQRLRQEFERRQQRSVAPGQAVNQEGLQGSLHKVRQSIARLIDAYTAGLLEAGEFEPRIRRLRERLAKLETELRVLTEQAQHEEQLRGLCRHLEEFAEQMKAGLTKADGAQKRAILQALLKPVEVDADTLHIVYKVPLHPFAEGPRRGQLQDCGSRQRVQ
jgi:site-specific DNA recombinase